jgi:hypothetical protein
VAHTFDDPCRTLPLRASTGGESQRVSSHNKSAGEGLLHLDACGHRALNPHTHNQIRA